MTDGGWGTTGKHLLVQEAGPVPTSLPAAGCDGKNYRSASPRLTAPKSCLSANLDIFSPGLLVRLCFWQPGVTPTLPIASQKGLGSPRLECLETTQGGYESLIRQPEQTSMFCTKLCQRFPQSRSRSKKETRPLLPVLEIFCLEDCSNNRHTFSSTGLYPRAQKHKGICAKILSLEKKTELILIGCVQIFTMFAVTK